MNTHLYNDNSRLHARRQLRHALSRPEQVLWHHVRNGSLKGYKFRRQYGVGVYTLDFYCPSLRLAIEVDGDSHYTLDGQRHDAIRRQFLTAQHIRCIRVTNREIMENIEGVIALIQTYLT